MHLHDGKVLHPQFAADVGFGGRGAARAKMLQDLRVARENQQRLMEVILENEILIVVRGCQFDILVDQTVNQKFVLEHALL